jgi:ABC-2 type transport system ATP-binding protein
VSDIVIQTFHLQKNFGAKTAVADLTISVARGEAFGFLGPNGAGKTTSIKMLLGLVKPTFGEGEVLGAPLGDSSVRAKLGFLPEHFRFHDWLTGREFLRFHAKMFGMKSAAIEPRIDALLARVDMTDAAGRRLREYSKGMLQRIGLAQALLNFPEIVFLDEPTSGLDPLGRLLVRDIIAELRSEGVSVFLNSHLLSEIEVVCNRVVFFKKGRVAREIVLDSEPETISLCITAQGLTPEILGRLAELGANLHVVDQSVTLDIADEDRIPHIAQFLVNAGAALYRLETERPSLERMFLEVIGADERPG